MMTDNMRNNRGMALLMTLTIMTLLVASGLELNRRVRSAVVSTATARDRLTLSEMTTSAVHAAMAILNKDRKETPIDSIQEDWARPEKIAEVLAEIPFDGGKVSLSIQDELGKIQINSLVDFPKGRVYNESQKIMWDRFLRILSAQEEEASAEEEIEVTAIIDSVKDWLDSGDDNAITGLNGAEEDYYEGLDPPYTPANGPFMHVDELMKVKGITPALFQSGKERYGLSDFMTVFGMTQAPRPVDKKQFQFEGKININTAELPVLIALIPSENPEYAQAIYNYRNEQENGEFLHDLTGGAWYKNVPEVPSDLTIDPNLITSSSDFFRITATAELNGIERSANVVIHREKEPETGKWQCRVLSWQVE